MKCPYRKREEFDKWSPECKECAWFDYCVDLDKDGLGDLIENDDLKYNTPNDELEFTLKAQDEMGDNYPTYDTLHLKLLLNRERKELIEKLLIADDLPICIDDITDIKIDLGLWNLYCKKPKQVKKRKDKKHE